MKNRTQFLRQFISWLLAAMLLLSCAQIPALAEDWAEEEAQEEEIVYPDELLVGHPTAMKGDFFLNAFGTGTADIDVRALLHGYNLVNWDQNQGTYVFDTSVVDSVRVMADAEGNKQYFLTLWDDLYYSDGTPITAWDYAFSILLSIAPEIGQIGGKMASAEYIVGYDQYIRGETPYLTGVEVPTDHQLVITLDHDYLPYFYETGLLLCVPYPISVIAPGCRVYNSGSGVYIANEDPDVAEPLFTAELLRKTILDPQTGYNSHPSVVSGPYVLTEYEGQTAKFEVNPYFKGTMDGTVPAIEKISFTETDSDTMLQQLADGELHLVNKAVYGPTIMEGMMTGAERGIRFTNYARVGLTFVAFTYERPAVREAAVRQAIAYCMDRAQITTDYCQGFGLVVDGFYGMEQWENRLVNGQMEYPIVQDPEHPLSDAEYEAAVAAWEELNLDGLQRYELDMDEANRLLNENGWTLNREGGAYRPGEDDVRCKNVDGELVALDLTMLYPAATKIEDTMQANFVEHLGECGIRLTMVPASTEELFNAFERAEARTTDMIYLGTNFDLVVDPAVQYSADTSEGHAVWNNTYSDDEELYRLAVDMRRTEPGDTFAYIQKWIAFQERFTRVLPVIPVYSNVYYDFYTDMLQNYEADAHVTWSQAVVEAFFGSEADLEEEDGEDDDDVIFFDW